MKFLSSTEHNGRYFEERLAPLTYLHSIFFSTMEVNGAKQLFGSNRSSKYLPLCSETHTGLHCNILRVSKWWQNFYFWVECPFKCAICIRRSSVGVTSEAESNLYLALKFSCICVLNVRTDEPSYPSWSFLVSHCVYGVSLKGPVVPVERFVQQEIIHVMQLFLL